MLKGTEIMKKFIALISVFAIIFAFAGCGAGNETATSAAPDATNAAGEKVDTSDSAEAAPTEKPTLSGGYSKYGNTKDYAYAFYMEIVNKAGESKKFEIYTKETTLSDALTKIAIIKCEEEDSKLVVKTVDGETHNYETEGYAWVVYANGELVEKSLDEVQIKQGDNFLFRVETY